MHNAHTMDFEPSSTECSQSICIYNACRYCMWSSADLNVGRNVRQRLAEDFKRRVWTETMHMAIFFHRNNSDPLNYLFTMHSFVRMAK